MTYRTGCAEGKLTVGAIHIAVTTTIGLMVKHNSHASTLLVALLLCKLSVWS